MKTYQHITVQLVGTDGNVFALIGTVTRALRRGGVPAPEVKEAADYLMGSKSYDQALQRIMELVEVS